MNQASTRPKVGSARRYKTKEDPRPCDRCRFSNECAVVMLRCPRFVHWADSGKDDESKPLAIRAHNMQLKLDNAVRN